MYDDYVNFDKSQIVGFSNDNLKSLSKYLIEGEINSDIMDSKNGTIIIGIIKALLLVMFASYFPLKRQ